MARSISEASPHVTCSVLDLPDVIAEASKLSSLSYLHRDYRWRRGRVGGEGSKLLVIFILVFQVK
jgi:hypothetical protein